MKITFRVCCSTLLLLWLLSVKSYGCSLIIIPPTQFNPAEFIFSGEVVGYSGPLTNRYVVGEIWGLIVKPERVIYLPSVRPEYFEVYLYRMEADCTNIGRSVSDLSQYFPVSSKVRVIAVEARNLEGGTPSRNVRLAVPIRSDGGVAVIRGDSPPISAGVAYDYRAYRVSNASRVDLTLEVRKDLLRLWRAGSEREQVAILERLLYHPQRIDYAKIVNDHIEDRAVAQSLIRRRAEWERSEFVGREN